MANEYKFPKVYKIDTVPFFNGEQPAPSKFTGIFQYINSAFYDLERFIGNGIDFAKPGPGRDRYNILSISSAIGHMDKVYASFNKIDTLFDIVYKYLVTDQVDTATNLAAADRAIWDKNNKAINVLSSFYLPIGKKYDNDHYLCIHFSAKTNAPIIQVAYNDGTVLSVDMTAPSVVLNTALVHSGTIKTDHVLKYTTALIPRDKYIEGILFDKASATEFYLFSIVLVENTEDLVVIPNFKSSNNTGNPMPLNKIYSIGTMSPSFRGASYQSYATATRCKHAAYCSQAMASNNGYCVGNTYDYYVNDGFEIKDKIGAIKCAGTIFMDCGQTYNAIDISIRPYNINATSTYLQYEAEQLSVDLVSFQSPLYTQDKAGIMRLHPVLVSDAEQGSAIGDNLVCVYDTQSPVSPIVTTTMLYAYGKTTDGTLVLRPDVAYLENTNSEISVDNINRYILVGGKFGVGDAVEKALNANHATTRAIAVYAE